MSTTDGAGAPDQDGEARVVQIYPRVSQNTAAYCPLQVSFGDTVKSVIHNAVVTLGLDSSKMYRLLEVRQVSGEERLLEAGDCPLERVLLWPPLAQRWHPQSQGYHFILQQQQADNGDNQEENREDYDDLCDLQSVTEQSILEVLRQRFYKLKIYTYASNILIAINPNKFLPVYYNPKYVKMYENQPLGKLSPHIFAIADVAFHTMLTRQVNQCIVISGESGSGKTESSSYLIHCLTALSQKTYSTGLERTILGAGPVLEAFGNAKTAENNNSSRFGKFIQLNYLESGVIRGAVIEKYLLEKCRLVSRDKRESRNYHVFYYLLVGASKDEQEEFHLLKPQDYLYLKQQHLQIDDEEKFRQEYKRLHQAMEMVGFLASTKKHIFSILSAILHLGNVTFTVSEDTQDLEVGPAEVLCTLSGLLKVFCDLLCLMFLCIQASKVRDSMAKSLYILMKCIITLPCLSIGVLDMFGFENLQTNSFEQLCINYTNEKLQYYINHNIFKLEQEDYVSEGLTWQNIDCTDNSGCIQLISMKSTGLFDLLDEESNLPQGTDETLLDKLTQQHQDNPLFVASPSTNPIFAIQHFAGSVEYHIKDFREKNTEHMRPEVVSLLRSSERAFLHHLVASSPQALFRWGILRATIRILTVFKNMGRQRAEHCNTSPDIYSNSLTLDFSFDHSDDHPLDVFEDIFANYEKRKRLMETIEKADPFFIFCVRSNKELHFDDELVLQQIRYTGMLQMVHIQKSGYSAKYTFMEFVDKFRMLLPKGATATPEHITKLFERMKLDKSTYQIGKTKVFLKQKEKQLLQDTLNKEVMRHIIILQRWFRTCLIRLHFVQKRDATLIIQVHFILKHRQHKVELSPGRNQQLDSVNGQSAQRDQSREKRGSPPPLNRPLSLPLDTKVGSDDHSTSPSTSSSLQRYKDMGGIKEKAEKWRGRQSEGEPTDESISQVLDSSAIIYATSSFNNEVRLRKQPKRKRRLAYARSGLMINFGGSKESEYWSFPLPPISPHLASLKSSASSVDCLVSDSHVRLVMLSLPLSPTVTLPRYTPHHYHMPNQSSERDNRNPTIRISRATRAIEWNTSLDREITDSKELRNLDEFLGNQVNELRSRIKELSPTESIFLTATMQFRETIKSMYSVQKPQIAYKDLMKGYHNKVNTLAAPKKKAEVSLVVNLFQSVLDGFIRGEIKRVESEPLPRRQRRGGKRTNPDSPLDHLFSTYQVNIMQSCDLCGSYIWGMEKAYMCSACKLICHKKCLKKIITDCSTRVPGSLHFGVQVCVLTSKANPVPMVVEMLLLHVELNGLYTEGIYRKSGSTCRARELHQILETNPEEACLENYPIHTTTGLVKRWLRELPDPLMTFSLYSDFLHAVELPEKAERIRAVYQKVDELPPSNYNTLERLIFHLVRVAKEEEHNKMSPSSLAIVFAPCILRSPDANDPFLGMKDVSKTTQCVEILISEQFRRYKEKMQNIQELEYAEALAVNQLKLRRQNTVRGHYKASFYASTLTTARPGGIMFSGCPCINLSSCPILIMLTNLIFLLPGKVTMRLKTQKPDCPHKPPDLAQRVRSMMAQADDEQTGFTSGQKTDVTQFMCFLPSQDNPSPTDKPQVTSKTFNGSFDDLDIPFIDEDEDLA
uniref:Myosin IXb n=1 Tax=Seriola lalandi dorsalis TaxID=1841481 RepID=A0A3B4XCH9_SERLL